MAKTEPKVWFEVWVGTTPASYRHRKAENEDDARAIAAEFVAEGFREAEIHRVELTMEPVPHKPELQAESASGAIAPSVTVT